MRVKFTVQMSWFEEISDEDAAAKMADKYMIEDKNWKPSQEELKEGTEMVLEYLKENLKDELEHIFQSYVDDLNVTISTDFVEPPKTPVRAPSE